MSVAEPAPTLNVAPQVIAAPSVSAAPAEIEPPLVISIVPFVVVVPATMYSAPVEGVAPMLNRPVACMLILTLIPDICVILQLP